MNLMDSFTRSQFLVPPLVDKPQNPIVKTLHALAEPLPPELGSFAENLSNVSGYPNTRDSLWFDAARRVSASRNQVMSWDGLRSCRSANVFPSPFLSEQDIVVFAAARYNIQPPIQDPTTSMIHVKLSDVLESLRMTVLGCSSVLHTWNKSSETFVQSGARDGTRAIILIDGMDEIIGGSFIRRFLTIGTLLRRIETFILALRSRSAREGPTIHAFTHSLSTILVFLRDSLARSPLYDPCPGDAEMIATIWIHYAGFEDILLALSVLCNRGEEKPQSGYAMLDSSPAQLLSRVYDHLHIHTERHSSREIIATFAYILTNSSRDYFRALCQDVGFGANSLGISRSFQMHHDLQLPGSHDDNPEDDIFEEVEIFPTFFPPDLAHTLPAAKRSLKLLQAAQPDHPLLIGGRPDRGITWMWSEDEITAAWHNIPVMLKPKSPTTPEIASPSLNYKPDLADFCIFDLEPGSHLAETAFTEKSPITSTVALKIFIATFPDRFPSITPSLEHVTAIVFTPLLEHATSLSTALLYRFLSPSHLNFQAHLTLLRSYLLLTSDSFKSRLTTTLFSDSEEGDSDGQDVKLPFRPLFPKPSESADTAETARSWVIGLAPALMQRETWPPGGADLSFLLRTVIVDSLGLGHVKAQSLDGHTAEKSSGRQRVFEEAEFRLGFAIRDLPVGKGRKRWLNPLSIEALDFLYLDYKPPHPLEVMISPEILSKYQRIFAFILRMMRVKNAACALFRMTRKQSKPLFATLASSNKLLLHFRFIAHSFVDSLSAYVFDTAIGSHFDPFLSCLSSGAMDNGIPKFPDVFSLAKYHSMVLDDILDACLLRSGQRAVGDLLRQGLEIVLDFAILASDLNIGRLAEYQAAPMMEDLFQVFRVKMTTLTMVLKSLAEKGLPDSQMLFEEGPVYRRPNGPENLYNLLIRLDFGDWWSKTRKKM